MDGVFGSPGWLRNQISFDRYGKFCHACFMIHPCRKFVAVLLAIWLPLFSGSALAASVAMQKMSGDCPSMSVQPDKLHAHQLASAHHYDQSSNQDHSSGQQNSSCKDCGVCHFACSGYLASFAIKVTESLQFAQIYASSSTRFQSFSSAPLDPPPLSRV